MNNENVKNGYTIGELTRLKSSVPFSQRLNDFIIERAKGLKYKAGKYDEISFENFKWLANSEGYMQISNENCEGTIFGDANINIMIRAWHDSIHLELNEDFDYMAEARVAFAQCAELPIEWGFERQLILIEVIAQASHHQKYGTFVEDQRKFTINTLQNGRI